MTERSAAVRQAYLLAFVGWPILAIYAAAQMGLCLMVAPDRPELKLVVEPYLLLIGLIMHVHWRKATLTLWENGLRRPIWIAAGDCLSFVVTFWAFTMLVEAFLQEARLI